MTAILPLPAVRRRPAPAETPDARATRLMDEFRRTGGRPAFEELAAIVQPQLLARARRRCRLFAEQLDPQEVVQDTLVNIFRFPDRFEPRRPQAFRVWSSRILDNVIRRRLRDERARGPVLLCPAERLHEEVDRTATAPVQAAADHEDEAALAASYRLFLQAYLTAFAALSERERFVLQMVEVHGLRYAELGGLLGIRGDALKMVVFRARRRIFDRLQQRLG